MKLCATSSNSETDWQVARAARPLPEPALAYFPDARTDNSDRDLVAGVPLSRSQGIAMADNRGHIPVLLDRCVELLTPALTRQQPDGTGALLVDATLGAGGHAERFLRELPGLRLVGLDRDPDALWIAGERLAPFGDRVVLVRTRYDGIEGRP
jgi:16S rRNA (cytosine1402-N4)-methyltransferase